MAYKVVLKIKGNEKEFTRSSLPNLHDVTMAMKVNIVQSQMFPSDTLETMQEVSQKKKLVDEYEKTLAEFAAAFWNYEFSVEDVIKYSDVKSVKAINKAYVDSLNLDDDADDEKK